MKNYFRYGYDPWMIGMTIVILIVEALGFFLGGENTYDPFANIPFWLLPLYIIAMIAMFLTACFIKNDAFQEERGFYKSPLSIASIIFLLLVFILGTIFRLVYPKAAFYISLLLPISIGIAVLRKKNWIAFSCVIFFFLVQILACFYLPH